MSAAIWIAAKRKSFDWRRFWPAWRYRNKPSQVKSCTTAADQPLALVGCYECCEGLNHAAEAFAAAAFGGEDAVIVRAPRRAQDAFWSKLCAWGRTRLAREEALRPDIPLDVIAANTVLSFGGGFVLVRSAARFHEACEIIERTGGRIGCI